jgi:hypothetical protein
VTVLADDDVVVDGMPSGAAMSTIALVIWMSACDGEGSYFGDKTLRMNDASGATLDIIEPLAAHAHGQLNLIGLADPHEQMAASFEAAICAWMGRCRPVSTASCHRPRPIIG